MAGVGNIFRTDDGFGGAVVEQVDRQRPGAWPDGVVVRDYGIRGVHLAYELLEPYDLVVLVDTVHRDGPPGTVYAIEPDLGDGAAGSEEPATADGTPAELMDAHELSPQAVLALIPVLGGTLGRVVVVGCEPASLADGMGLTPVVEAAVGPAARAVQEIVDAAVGTDRPAPVRTALSPDQ